MTRRPNPSRYRQIRLSLSLGRAQTSYTMVLRTVTGDDVFDRRLSMGVLEQRLDPEDPRDVLDLLERAVHDLRRRHGLPASPQGPGAPGGGGGRHRPVTPGDASTMPLSVVRDTP